MIRNDRDAWRRQLMASSIPISSAPTNETGSGQTVQLTHRTGELQDGVQSMQLYGFASSPNSGTDHLVIYLEGDRNKGVAIASNDQRVRPKNMAGGEVQIYDASGQFFYLKTGKSALINAINECVIQIDGTPIVTITPGGVTTVGNLVAGNGATGTFTDATGKVITVQDGIVTNIF